MVLADGLGGRLSQAFKVGDRVDLFQTSKTEELLPDISILCARRCNGGEGQYLRIPDTHKCPTLQQPGWLFYLWESGIC